MGSFAVDLVDEVFGGFGPDEGFRAGVVAGGVGADRGLEFVDAWNDPRRIACTDGRSGPSTTVSTVTVVEILATPAAVSFGSGFEARAGQSLDIYQFGVPGALVGGVPVLKQGATHLLFLRPTGMDGSDSTDFLITGEFSGVYELMADGHFEQQPIEGEELPPVLSNADLAALTGE